MKKKATTVFGVYPSFGALRTGIDQLKISGFHNVDISVLFPELAVARTPPAEGGSDVRAGRSAQREPLIGGSLGELTYLGPANEGIVSKALESLGVPEAEASRYEKHIGAGRLLVCVRSGSCEQSDVAKDMLSRTGASQILSSGEPGTDGMIDRALLNPSRSLREGATGSTH